MEIKSVFDIENLIHSSRLLEFWNKLNLKSKELILLEYLRNKEVDKSSDNVITLCEDKLVVEQSMGFHKIWSHNLDKLFTDKILTSQAFINGRLCNPPMEGNIAPFCTHFVASPFDFIMSDLSSAFREMETSRLVPENWGLFRRDLENFNSMRHFMNSHKFGYLSNFPVILTYKRKNNDIDIMNDNHLSIHTEFRKYSYIVDSDDDGYPEFDYYINRTMAILGGVNINNLDGIIICEGFWNHPHFKFEYTLDEFINYLIQLFPNLYISNEFGKILYKPKNAKIRTLKMVANPFNLESAQW